MSASSSSSVAPQVDQSSEEEMFRSIVESMGIKKYDEALLAALSEYAHTFSSDILCDAKDYATHARRHGAELTEADVRLALKMRDANVTVRKESVAQMAKTREVINKRPLPEIPETPTFTWPEHANLLTQFHTYVPSNGVNASPSNSAVGTIDASSTGKAAADTSSDPVLSSVWRREDAGRSEGRQITMNEDAIKKARIG